MVLIFTGAAAIILRVSENTARRKLKALRAHYKLLKHQPISIAKFCEYFALEEDRVLEELKERGVG